MANEIAVLSTSIVADNRKFIRAVNESVTKAKDLTTQMSRVGNALKLGAAVASVALLTNRIYKAADGLASLEDLGNRFKMPVAEFQALEFAVTKAGVGSDSLKMMLGVMSKQLGAASMGSQDLLDVLDELGVDLEDLGRLTPKKQFEALITAVGKMEDGFKKATVASKLFGKGYKDIELLTGANLSKEGQRFADMGLGLSGSEVAAGGQLADNMELLEAVGSSFYNKIVAGVAPAFTEMTQNWIDAVTESGSLERTAKTVADILVKGVKTAVSLFETITDFGSKLGLLASDVVGARQTKEATGSSGYAILDDLLAAQDRISMGINDVLMAREDYNVTGSSGSVITDGVIKVLNTFSTTIAPLDEHFNSLKQSVVNAIPGINGLEKVAEAANKASKALESIKEQEKDTNELNKDISKEQNKSLKDLFGFKDQKTWAKGYLDVVKMQMNDAKPQRRSEYFDKEILNIMQRIGDGEKISPLEITRKLDALEDFVAQSSSVYYDANGMPGIESEQAMLAVLAEMRSIQGLNKKASDKSQEKQQVEVKITADKDGMIKAVLNSSEGKRIGEGWVAGVANRAAAETSGD